MPHNPGHRRGAITLLPRPESVGGNPKGECSFSGGYIWSVSYSGLFPFSVIVSVFFWVLFCCIFVFFFPVCDTVLIFSLFIFTVVLLCCVCY